ncbi:MAG: carboxypeptidase-like regulatory domain-containing protein [Planctomycetota bacterium]
MWKRANEGSFAGGPLRVLAATVLTTSLLWAEALPDSYPRLFFNQNELSYVRARLGERPWNDILANILDVASHAGTPRIDRDYTLADIDYLYSGPWFLDADEAIHLAMAYQLTGNTSYRDKAIEVVRRVADHIDTTPVPAVWWITIRMDIMGMKTLMTFDLVRDAMSDDDVRGVLDWFKGYAEAVKYYHVSGTDGGYYTDHKAGGNCKAWDNAMIGCVGLAACDPALVEWAVSGTENGLWAGRWIPLSLEGLTTHAIVEEWSGPNSEYGPYRIVDWYRAIRDNQDYIESVSYATYHVQAASLLCEGLKQHHVDMYRYVGLSDPSDGDGRHRLLQPVARIAPFLTLEVPPEHNQFHTRSGNGWIYTDDDRYEADLSIMKLTAMVETFRCTALQPILTRYQQMQDRGLHNGYPFRDFHFWGYLWPLKLWQVRDYVTGLGAVKGRVRLEDGGATSISVRLDIWDQPAVEVTELTLPVDTDGSYEVNDLPPGTYLLRFEADGYRSIADPFTVGEGETVSMNERVLRRGACTISPDRGLFLRRRDITGVDFRYYDPDDWTTMPDLYVFTLGGGGAWLEIYPKYGAHFDYVPDDPNAIHIRLPLESWPGWAANSFMFLVADNDTGSLWTTWVNYPDP